MGTISAFKNHLSQYTDFLSRVGSTNNKGMKHVDDPSVYVFLQHEMSNRLGDRKLVHSIIDTLILWALRNTDPDTESFMTRDEVHQSIIESFPWSKSFINGHVDSRLEQLKKKDALGRQIRWYNKDQKYCLPFETRGIIREENTTDEALKIECNEELRIRASELCDGDDSEFELLANLAIETVEQIFQKQGLLLSHFVSDNNDNSLPLIASDCISEIVDRCNAPIEKSQEYKNVVSHLLNSLLYNSSPTQRKFLHHLSRTYVLLFTLKAEPRIVEYFSSMGANFRLFVGTDILVKALSERFVQQEDQSCRNILKASADAGMKLCLSSSVLDEIHAHFKATYWEFENYIASVEQYVNRDFIRNCEKIFIRAYFYAKEQGDVRSWGSFVEQFISYKNVTSEKGRDELKKYLISEFKLTFYENEELEELVSDTKVKGLAQVLLDKGEKENIALAHNSALLVHGIYGLRKRDGETNSGSPFGCKTWWLTNQKKITKHTHQLVKRNFSKYIMRPEFISRIQLRSAS